MFSARVTANLFPPSLANAKIACRTPNEPSSGQRGRISGQSGPRAPLSSTVIAQNFIFHDRLLTFILDGRVIKDYRYFWPILYRPEIMISTAAPNQLLVFARIAE